MVDDLISRMILLLMAIATLKWLVAKQGWFPRNKKWWSRLIYNDEYDRYITKEVLNQIGFRLEDVKTLVENTYEPTKYEYDRYITKEVLNEIGFKLEDVKTSVKNIYEASKADTIKSVVSICANCITSFPQEKVYGTDTVVLSKYYINTMEAAHDPEERAIMATALLTLCAKEIGKIPDFILTPKAGNPYIAFEIQKYCYNTQTIIIKNTSESSYVRGQEIDPVNFEGINRIISDSSAYPNKQFWGVAIDCNASGGKNIKNSINDFNLLIEKQNLQNIKKVDSAFVLFRPDNEQDIDADYEASNLNFYRYFDLNDTVKEKIHNLKEESKKINMFNIKQNEEIAEIICEIEKNNLLYYKETSS